MNGGEVKRALGEIPAADGAEVAARADPSTVRPKKPGARQPPHGAAKGTSRRWFAIDERPRAVRFAMTPAGRVALFTCFGLLLALSLFDRTDLAPLRLVPIVLAGAAGAAFWQARRDLAIFVATAATLAMEPEWYTDAGFGKYLETIAGDTFPARDMQRVLTVALFALVALGLRYVVRRPTSSFARRPVLSLLGLISVATLTGLLLDALGVRSFWLVASIKILASYMWFISYAVADQRSKQRGSLLFALGLLHPFWGSSSTPIGKGSGYLAKLRSGEPEKLARVQLKGLKLLVWSLVLQVLSTGLTVGSQWLGIPSLEEIVRAFAKGQHVSIFVGWCAMVVAVTIGALELAIWGHRIVACARLAGFHLRRNTWRPLGSRTLADFWNRYYYYFKELLLDFFFYPTFFRLFKKRPRLRTFCATFMAAGVGNAIFHFVRDIEQLFTLGPVVAIEGYGSYAFYCLMLASGIAISQVRTGDAPRSNSWTARVWSFACVWGFVVSIHVFGGIEDRTLSFATRASFTLHQLGFGS